MVLFLVDHVVSLFILGQIGSKVHN